MATRNTWVYGALLIPLVILLLGAKFNLGITDQVDKLSKSVVQMIGKDSGPWMGYSCTNTTNTNKTTSCTPIPSGTKGSSYVVLPSLMILMIAGAIGGYFISKK